jgi:glycosyltransferase involved in cell wall biosynthesis
MNYSLVLMAYNQEDYVAEAVAAALAQEGPPLEIIMSDDCSPDATFRIMQQVVAEYRGPHHVTLRRNETNLGLVAHFHRMFGLCSGDVMIVAWGDDASMPDRALRIREVFDATDAWLVHSHATCVDLSGNEIPPTYLSAHLLRETNLETLATSTSLYVGATGAYHRKILQKYGQMTNPRAYEDLVYGFRAALENGVRFIDRPLVKYVVGSGISTRRQPADAAGKRLAKIRRMKTQLAVLSQRRRDALVFGFARKDRIPTLIDEQRLSILFQLYFMGATSGERYFKLMVRHPVLGFRALQLVQKQDRNAKTPSAASSGVASVD